MRMLGAGAVMLFAAVLATPPAAAKRVRPSLKYIEINGSSKVTPEAVQTKYQQDIERLLLARARRSTQSGRDAQRYEAAIVNGVKDMGGFAWIRLHIIELEETADEKPYMFIFEVVEKKDMATRMPFRSDPTDDFPDTSNLIEAWGRYEALGRAFEAKSVTVLERPDCLSFYCVWGALTPELGKLEKEFAAGVPVHRELLEKILREHRNPVYRKNALFLLAYLRDGSAVSGFAASGLMDPDAGVRDAAVSVLNDLTVHHTDVPVAIHEINRLLDVPFPGDRTKALALMLNLADNPNYKRFLVKNAARQIMKLLRSRHPNNHNMAYTVLGILSGESFDQRDYDAWDRWHWTALKELETPSKE